ncbi:glutamine synthetase family protein [Dasania sp. GY-MA-18]|uniref:Glutamine synthetase family protein n=1 Tax=Dasania phycosphaerae TaxID=2950436 RepID=A0A9J6RLV8_9GAMM|nr:MULTISPECIES: glutamine synthetase family protein [Dasania]MCR8922866.1 glutamine synthetase family protein [Dasania sp. GY-MA-18]MCZ0865297.1 glutamine synthetase family protein [Dasania phycosphaerae]MCZ0869022.1 glutamine synthetase family protein [Dasania phycosphaerae]
MSSSTIAASVAEWLKQHAIEEVECIIPNMVGNAIGKFISPEAFLQNNSRMPESLLAMTVTGDYAEDHFDFMDPKDIDMFLTADCSTLRLVPWAKKPTAQVVHSCFDKNGVMHPVSSRGVLQRVLKLYADEGWTPVVAPEMEFYVTEQNLDPKEELRPPVGNSGRRETAPPPFGIDAMNEYSDFVKDLYDCCYQQNIDVEGLVHECGTAQFEINFNHGDALYLADQVFAFKRTVRQVALQHKLHATFMAKPYQHEPGSAMHIHQSVLDQSGKNIFVDEQGNENARFLNFIGGMQKYTPYCLSLYAPNINSYRRYSSGHSAPANMEWGYENRNVGLRVPESPAIAKRVENRYPGADSNPYLALAASLACGYLGIKHKCEASEPHKGDAAAEGIKLSRDLLTSLNLLDALPELVDVFGETFVMAYKAVKAHEFEVANRVVTAWEREHLLLNV